VQECFGNFLLFIVHSFIPRRLPVRRLANRDDAAQESARGQPKDRPTHMVASKRPPYSAIAKNHRRPATQNHAADKAKGDCQNEVWPFALFHDVWPAPCATPNRNASENHHCSQVSAQDKFLHGTEWQREPNKIRAAALRAVPPPHQADQRQDAFATLDQKCIGFQTENTKFC
jgi:hypothetical protein